MEDIAAHNLLHQTLSNGWKVILKHEKQEGDTGGTFSVCYTAVKDGIQCFLKAFNINGYANTFGRGMSHMDHIQMVTDAYQYEKRLSEYCQDNRTDKIVCAIGSGEQEMPGYTYPLVPYLLFDMADGNVKHKIKFSSALDFAWKLKSLHDVAMGIKQLHGIDVLHQDIKPSNILVFAKDTKIGDIGNSKCDKLKSPYQDFSFSGDHTYAPPELWYCSMPLNDYAVDCYLLGSLIVYYTTGLSMTPLLKTRLKEIAPSDTDIMRDISILYNVFNTVLDDIYDVIPLNSIRDELIEMIKYLCDPDPAKRGHPRTILLRGNNYNLERFISKLDLLRRKSEIDILKQR